MMFYILRCFTLEIMLKTYYYTNNCFHQFMLVKEVSSMESTANCIDFYHSLSYSSIGKCKIFTFLNNKKRIENRNVIV